LIRRRAPFLAALLAFGAALASMLLASAATADEPLSRPEAVPPPIVESVSPTGYRVRVPVGEAQVTRGRVYGFDLAEIAIAGGSAGTAWGEPALPTRVVLLRVPWGAVTDVRGARQGARSLGALEPSPIPHLIAEEFVRRRLSPRALAAALSGPAYRALGGAGEAPAVVRATPMASAGERVLAVTLAPVTWDPATREARIAEEIVLDVSWDRPETPLAPAPALAPGAPVATRAPGAPVATLIAGAAGPRYAARARSGLAAPRRLGAAAAAGPMRVDPTRTWVRLMAPRGGLYRVTPADLAAAGVTPGGIDPATFRLFRANPGDLPESLDVDTAPDSLRECAIEVTGNGDGVFGGGDALCFYASGETGFGYDLRRGGGTEYEETQRTDQQPMWLTWGPGLGPAPPRRMATRDASPVTVAAPLYTAVTHRVHIEENQTAAFDLFRAPLRWERWFMSLLQSVQATTRRRFPTALPGALPDGAVSLRVRMWGSGVSTVGASDHVVRIYWNRALADTAEWDASAPRDITVSGLRTNGALDSVDIEVPYLGRLDVQYLAWYEAVYPRRLAAANDTLQFVAPDSVAAARVRYAISGITDTTAAWLLDRTDPESPVRLVSGAWSGVTSPFTLTVEDSAGPGYRPRYSLVSTARAPTPALTLYAPPSGPGVLADLLDPANAADYLIVAPPSFLAAAESLAVERSTRLPGVTSPRAAIATTDRIYAQLGGGRPDPVAIRNLLVHASRHWSAAPLYLCLLGDATEDPKNYTRFATPDWVPTYGEYWDGTGQIQFISDDFFAFLDGPGDRLFDLALGRLPAHDRADAMALVRGKRATFDLTADFDWWRTRALLTADDAWKWFIPDGMRDPAGADHVQQMERKDAFHIPFAVRREKVYLNDYPFADSTKTSKPKARDAFIAAANAGNWLVDYIGHGNGDFLADEQVLRSSDLARLTNASRPSIFGFFSCEVGRFDENGREGLAELLLRYPGGGAAVSLAASREVFGFSSTLLNDSFVDNLFPLTLPSGAPRVDSLRTAGLAWALAKNVPANLNEVARKYAFLGEPAVTPPLPRGRGEWEKGPLDSIPRGEVLVMRGHALNADNVTRDSTSSGTVLLEVLGPPSPRIQVSTLNGANVPTPYSLPGPVLYRGETTLDNGAFTLRFVVPTDGRVVGRGAQLRALLSSAGGEGVGLAADSLIIAAALSPRVDQTPPTIRLRPAAGSDSSYAPGAVLTFEIEDSSGVDLTRFDNAHGIFVIVDDRGTPIDLTSSFRYEPSSFTRGTATLTLPKLTGGAHLLEVHASDAYRNVGVATFIIDVSEGAGPNAALTMTEVFNYPNPFPRDTYLHARLNRAARLRVQILTVSGRRVRDFTVEGKSGENYIPWDGRDSEGEKVGLGVYLVKLTAEASGGNRVTAVARALRAE
jgi:hypothetical protein